MKTKLNQKKYYLVLIAAGLFLTACGIFFRGGNSLLSSNPDPSGSGSDASVSNGERIYFTATNDSGQRISYSGGPRIGGMMMGGYQTCAACHGPEARGGIHIMHMQVMDAPDIRFAALSSENDEHGAEENEHGDEHGEYDLEAFRMAVVEGRHPNGDSLSREMPRWRMSDQDLADLFDFLKTIP